MLTVVTLLGSAVTSWAAAGIVGEPTCCCPNKSVCKCHDHDGQVDTGAKLKRCGGEARLVQPEDAPLIAAPAPMLVQAARVAILAMTLPYFAPDDPTTEPEKPPF